MMASLEVSPESALVDEDVTIVIEGLQKHQAVTLVAVLREEKVKMASYAHYMANKNGIVNVSRMESLGGTYTGIEPMGFIWSMEVTEDKEAGHRLMKRNIYEPIKIDVQFYKGHITSEDAANNKAECLASQQVERWYSSNDVERLDVREGRIVATLFVPKGDGLFPGVLDLFGTVGGLNEYRASLLASHGFVTMALAYYWPNERLMTDLEYYEEALEYLWKHPKVLKTGLGTIGVSKGAELTSLIAVISPKLRAVVGINGPPSGVVLPSTYHGETFDASEFGNGVYTLVVSDEGISFEMEEGLDLGTVEIIPIERSVAKFLLIHGADDRNTPGLAAELFPARLAEVGRPDDCKVLMYEGAGHLIEPPHSPHFSKSYHKAMDALFIWGGEPKQHARAQEDSWQQIQNFLRQTLTNLPQETITMVSLKVCPRSALVDEDVSVVIEGLQKNQPVTLVAVLKEEKVKMASYAHYLADENGFVDVTKLESLGGTYTGVEPMGFIWSMQITENKKAGHRLMKRNVHDPIKIDVQIYNGHITIEEVTKGRTECQTSCCIERWYLSNNTERIEVRSGRLVATMFVPKGEGPFPGVLDLFGSIGGLVEYRASLLASHGFVTMALAYYWPHKKIIIDLEYFEEALEYLWKHPKVLKTGLGALGVSKGAELTSLIAVIAPKLKAAVGINGPPCPVLTPSTYHGETFEAVDYTQVESIKTEEGYAFSSDQYYHPKIVKPIPIERSQAKFLLIHGADDHNTQRIASTLFPARLAEVGRPNDCKVLIYEGAGHLIEPPHSPHFRTSYHSMLNGLFLWGGEPKLHARAQEDSWEQIQAFLRHILTSLPQQTKSKL